MNNNISLPGLEEFIMTDSFKKDGVFQLHMELERKLHKCPSCKQMTNSIHDYRIQKIQHTKIFSRETKIMYKNVIYLCPIILQKLIG